MKTRNRKKKEKKKLAHEIDEQRISRKTGTKKGITEQKRKQKIEITSTSMVKDGGDKYI